MSGATIGVDLASVGADPSLARVTPLRDGRVLVTGGWRPDRGDIPRPTAEIYDPAKDAFRSIGPMVEPRWRHTATLLDDGRVVLVGGVRRSPDRTDPEPAAVESFDPSAVP